MRIRGFTLVEVMVALLLLQVGLLATVGLLLMSQRTVNRAELLTRSLVAADRIADSLVEAGGGGSGGQAFPWGRVEWVGGRGGGLLLRGTAHGEGDTLVVLRVPPGGVQGERGPAGRGSVGGGTKP